MTTLNDIDYNEDHAVFAVNNLDINCTKYKKFTTSVDTAIFIAAGYDTQDKIDDVMKKIILTLVDYKLIVQESNGSPTNKNGIEIKTTRFRKITFDKCFIAYHNVSIDASIGVNPHFHLLIDPKSRTGISYTYLKKALSQIAKTMGIQFHFMSSKNNLSLSKKATSTIENMAMTLQRNTYDDSMLYLMDDKLENALQVLKKHFRETHNISYFLKQIQIVHQFLKNNDISSEINNVNLKDKIPFYLTKKQYAKLLLLKNEEAVYIDMRDVLDRKIYKYAHSFRSNTMDILVDKFNILKIKKEKLIPIFPLPDASRKTELSKNIFRNGVKQDIRNVISHASSPEMFTKMMLKMEYIDVKVIKKKVNQFVKKETTLKVKTKKHTTLNINFREIHLSWARILRIFDFNKRQEKKQIVLKSQIKNYKKKTQKIKEKEELLEFTYKMKEFLTVQYNKNCKFHLEFKPLLDGFKIHHSEMFNITTYLSKELIVVDYADRLEIKKCTDIQKGIDTVFKFLPEDSNLEQLDITLKGSQKYIEGIKKRFEAVPNSIKVLKKEQPKKIKFKK